MKLYSFQIHQQRKIGAELDGQLVDLSAGYNAWLGVYGPKEGALRSIPSDMLSFIRLGKLALEAARETISYFRKRPAVPVGEEVVHAFDAVKLIPPIPRPGKIVVCVPAGGNSASLKYFFAKFPSTVIGPGEPVVLGADSSATADPLLGLVIGKRTRNVAEDQVLNSAFGFTLLSDVTAREERIAENLALAKNFDTFCPTGPCIVTSDILAEASNPSCKSSVNGQVVSENPLDPVLAATQQAVSYLSTMVTLEPGDIVAVGPSVPGNSELRFIRAGDEIAVEIESIGRLVNPVVAG